MMHNHRFVIAEIAICNPEHSPIAESIESRSMNSGHNFIRNTIRPFSVNALRGNKVRDWNLKVWVTTAGHVQTATDGNRSSRPCSKRRIRWIVPIDVKFEHCQHRSGVGCRWRASLGIHFNNVVRRTSRRWNFPIKVRWILAARNISDTDGDGRFIEPNKTRWLSGEHLSALKRKRAGTRVGLLAARKLIACHIISIWPNANFWVVVEDGRALIKLVVVVGPGRI